MIARWVALSCAVWASAQSGDEDPKVRWLIDHAVELRPSAIDDDDFSDLAPLRRAIGDARIVALGEVNHLDGGTFAVRSRLIRFLHEEMGFDVLAWEAGLVDCQRMNDALKTDLPLQEAKERMMQQGWPESAVLDPLFAYVRERATSQRPLEMAGFDMPRSEHAEQYLNEVLDDVLARVPDAAISSEEVALVRAFLAGAVDSYAPRSPAEEVRVAARDALGSLIAALEGERSSIASNGAARQAEFELEVLRSTLAFEEVIHNKPLMMKAADPVKLLELGNLRDREMARLAIWLADVHYRGKKIILSAASAHLIRKSVAIDRMAAVIGERSEELGPMGERLARHFGGEMYTIAFTAWGGEYGAIFAPDDSRKSFTVPLTAAPSGSFEDLCHRTALPVMFVDLRSAANDHWLRRPLVASPLGFARDRGLWSDAVDGFVFIDVMTPDRMLPSSSDK